MAAVQLDRRLPTLYLDWSHLCAAFWSTVYDEYAKWKPLNELLHSAGANICCTSIHVLELVGLPRIDTKLAIAEWLDQVSLVWMESAGEQIEINEAKHAIMRELGVVIAPYEPFVGGFVSLFARGLGPAVAADMLSRPRLVELVRDNKARSVSQMRVESILFARDFALDRKRAVEEGFNEAELEDIAARASHHGFSKVLERAHVELKREDGYRSRGAANPSQVEVDQAIRRVLGSRTSLPALRIGVGVVSRFAFRVRSQDPMSRKFGNHRSSLLDLFHCSAGVAYCDVFTCDARTRLDLGELRPQFGRQPPLSEDQFERTAEFIQGIEGQLGMVRSNLGS